METKLQETYYIRKNYQKIQKLTLHTLLFLLHFPVLYVMTRAPTWGSAAPRPTG